MFLELKEESGEFYINDSKILNVKSEYRTNTQIHILCPVEFIKVDFYRWSST